MQKIWRTTPGEKPQAVIVDLDGTLVDVSSVRHHVLGSQNPDGSYNKKNFDAFHTEAVSCPAIWSTVDQVMDIWERGFHILIVTARSDKYYNQSAWWLAEHIIPHNALYMRPEGDYRPDYEVKKEILARIRQRYNVVHAIDDSPHVIQLWKDEGISYTHVPGWMEADS